MDLTTSWSLSLPFVWAIFFLCSTFTPYSGVPRTQKWSLHILSIRILSYSVFVRLKRLSRVLVQLSVFHLLPGIIPAHSIQLHSFQFLFWHKLRCVINNELDFLSDEVGKPRLVEHVTESLIYFWMMYFWHSYMSCLLDLLEREQWTGLLLAIWWLVFCPDITFAFHWALNIRNLFVYMYTIHLSLCTSCILSLVCRMVCQICTCDLVTCVSTW